MGFTSLGINRLIMKVVAVLMLVALATVSQAGPVEKRFLLKDINNIIHGVGDAFDAAKNAVNSLAHGLDFDGAVNALLPLIHSGMTVTACVSACSASSSSSSSSFSSS